MRIVRIPFNVSLHLVLNSPRPNWILSNIITIQLRRIPALPLVVQNNPIHLLILHLILLHHRLLPPLLRSPSLPLPLLHHLFILHSFWLYLIFNDLGLNGVLLDLVHLLQLASFRHLSIHIRRLVLFDSLVDDHVLLELVGLMLLVNSLLILLRILKGPPVRDQLPLPEGLAVLFFPFLS